MTKLISLSLQFVLLFLFAAPFAAYSSQDQDILVENIRVDAMNYTSTEYAWFTVSCTVRNTTEKSGTVSVAIRSIDEWAYDRKVLRLSGQVEAGETRTLTSLNFMDYKMFKNLRKYEVKSVELH